MLENGTLLENVLKSVVVDVIGRTLMTSTNNEPMTQMSEIYCFFTVQIMRIKNFRCG